MTKAKKKPHKSDKGNDEPPVCVENKVEAVEKTEPNGNCHGQPNETNQTSQQSISQQNLQNSSGKPWFQNEILCMMYAFGDARKPSAESARLIEAIVHKQISSLVVQTAEVTALRGGKFMHTEDVKFLMRKDKAKLQKLNMYLGFKESKQKLMKQISQDDDEILGAFGGNDVKLGNKRRRLSDPSSFEQLDDSSFLGSDGYDQRRERLERAEYLSRSLDTQQYLEFIECRQANFNKKAGKFKEWLDYTNLTDLKPNTPVMEVFSYLAYETVGQIVEMALLVKKDIERSDELSAVMPLLRENNASKINLPFITTSSMPSSRSSTPTPPSTPTTSIGGTQPSFSLGGATPTGGAGSNLTSLPGGVSSLSASSKSSKAKKKRTKLSSVLSSDLYSDCLQPDHIREAMRRYSHGMGPMAAFSPRTRTTPSYMTLCL